MKRLRPSGRTGMRLLHEELECRLPLSAVSFLSHSVVSNEATKPVGMFAADIDGDGDGDVDVLTASENGQITLFKNTDGRGVFEQDKVIANVGEARAVIAIDVDGDGDADALSSSISRSRGHFHSTLAWHENVDGTGTFKSPTPIWNDTNVYAGDITAADIDGDGDIDIVSAGDETAWFENMDGRGAFSQRKVISSGTAHYSTSVNVADIDGDGDVDVLATEHDANDTSIFRTVWYDNTDGKGNFGSAGVVTTQERARVAVAADLDGDGDVDVLTPSAWFENLDGQGSFDLRAKISARTDYFDQVIATDVDNDGDLDVVSAVYDAEFDQSIFWLENTDGRGTFSTRQLITTQARDTHALLAADVNGDGAVDVLSASRRGLNTGKVAWYQNKDGLGAFGAQKVITTIPLSAYGADFDDDGDVDILAALIGDKIVWYENSDGRGNFGTQNVVADEGMAGLLSVASADVDGDGDVDVLSASFYDSKIAWYENTDGRGEFGKQQLITDEATGAVAVYVADFDADGDIDVLSTHKNNERGVAKIAWYENTDGQGTFGSQQVVTAAPKTGDSSVSIGDVDSDGDLDIIAAYGSRIVWYENVDGEGTFGSQNVITSDSDGQAVLAGDLDGDGDLDVLSGWGPIDWYENTDGQGTFASGRRIADESIWAPTLADLDGDGDLDVLSGAAWFENTDGARSFIGPQNVVSAGPRAATSLYAADMDGDQDLDVISAFGHLFAGTVAWHENRPMGDANNDGRFDQFDVVYVLAAAKYATGEPANFDEGDWNLDGVFDNSDIVAALQSGNYLPL